MSDRMSEVQRISQAGILLVFLHDPCFDCGGPDYHFFQERIIEGSYPILVFLQKTEKFTVLDNGILDHLGHTVAYLQLGEAIECKGISYDEHRLMKYADVVLDRPMVNRRFTSDAAVNLRQQGCGDLSACTLCIPA